MSKKRHPFLQLEQLWSQFTSTVDHSKWMRNKSNAFRTDHQFGVFIKDDERYFLRLLSLMTISFCLKKYFSLFVGRSFFFISVSFLILYTTFQFYSWFLFFSLSLKFLRIERIIRIKKRRVNVQLFIIFFCFFLFVDDFCWNCAWTGITFKKKCINHYERLCAN